VDDAPDAEWPAHPDDFADDHTRPGVARWEGLGAVTGDPSRMHEKGPGKWTSVGRSREELADQLPPGETRPLDLTPPSNPAGGRLPLLLLLLLLGAGVIAFGWWVL